jgi:hypothetical protein
MMSKPCAVFCDRDWSRYWIDEAAACRKSCLIIGMVQKHEDDMLMIFSGLGLLKRSMPSLVSEATDATEATEFP